MNQRHRLVVFGAVVLVALGGATTYVLYARREATLAQRPTTTSVATADLASTAAKPHLAFRSTALGEGYGRLALVPLSDPAGPRALTPASCDRLYARPGSTICLVAQRVVAVDPPVTCLYLLARQAVGRHRQRITNGHAEQRSDKTILHAGRVRVETLVGVKVLGVVHLSLQISASGWHCHNITTFRQASTHAGW